MNPVLKKAGVVDAGGKGYLLILEGMLAALRGEPLPEITEDNGAQDKADFAALSAEDITFTFDTVFIVRKTVNTPLEPFRAYLNSIGDSLVIGEDDEAFKVHVHTDIPVSYTHLAPSIDHCIRRQRRGSIHPHIHRSILHVRESPGGVIQLGRGYPQVK